MRIHTRMCSHTHTWIHSVNVRLCVCVCIYISLKYPVQWLIVPCSRELQEHSCRGEMSIHTHHCVGLVGWSEPFGWRWSKILHASLVQGQSRWFETLTGLLVTPTFRWGLSCHTFCHPFRPPVPNHKHHGFTLYDINGLMNSQPADSALQSWARCSCFLVVVCGHRT